MNRFRVDGKIISAKPTDMRNNLENRIVETWLYELETLEHDVFSFLAPAGIGNGVWITIEGTLVGDGDGFVLHSDSLSWSTSYRSTVNRIGDER